MNKVRWSLEEDRLLLEMCGQKAAHPLIAKTLSEKFGIPRTVIAIQTRYGRISSPKAGTPSYKHQNAWSEDEDSILLELHGKKKSHDIVEAIKSRLGISRSVPAVNSRVSYLRSVGREIPRLGMPHSPKASKEPISDFYRGLGLAAGITRYDADTFASHLSDRGRFIYYTMLRAASAISEYEFRSQRFNQAMAAVSSLDIPTLLSLPESDPRRKQVLELLTTKQSPPPFSTIELLAVRNLRSTYQEQLALVLPLYDLKKTDKPTNGLSKLLYNTLVSTLNEHPNPKFAPVEFTSTGDLAQLNCRLAGDVSLLAAYTEITKKVTDTLHKHGYPLEVAIVDDVISSEIFFH